MTINKIIAAIFMGIFGYMQVIMSKIPEGFNDSNYLWAFIGACFSVVMVMNLVKE